MQAQERVSLVIKNPSARTDFCLSFDLNASVGMLKAHLAESYPGNPAHASQKLIFAGRLLQDKDILRDVFAQRRVRTCDMV